MFQKRKFKPMNPLEEKVHFWLCFLFVLTMGLSMVYTTICQCPDVKICPKGIVSYVSFIKLECETKNTSSLGHSKKIRYEKHVSRYLFSDLDRLIRNQNNVPLGSKKAGRLEKLLSFARSHFSVSRGCVSLLCATTP